MNASNDSSVTQNPAQIKTSKLRDIGLFFISPFVGLAYMMVFPVAILRMVIEMVRQQRRERESAKP